MSLSNHVARLTRGIAVPALLRVTHRPGSAGQVMAYLIHVCLVESNEFMNWMRVVFGFITFY